MTRHQRRPPGRRRGWLATGFVATLGACATASACDVCAIYTATELRENRPGLQLGLAEQFTSFETRQLEGDEVHNPGEWLRSSITQVLIGYNVSPRVGLQLNLPIIARDFRRLEDRLLRRDDESGVGDVSILANVLAFSRVAQHGVLRVSLLGGLKLPSGDSGRLREELAEAHRAGELSSALHGHDLALGSGSVDGIVGGTLFWSWQRLYATASMQYAVRTEGDFDYQYADDLTWAGGPGVFALVHHDATLGLQAVLSGETKGKDSLDGVPADDTGITLLYTGPAVAFTWGSALGADLRGEIPVVRNNTALQVVPDFRLRGGITWRF